MASFISRIPQQSHWFVGGFSSILANAISQRANTELHPRVVTSMYFQMRNSPLNQYRFILAEDHLNAGLTHVRQHLSGLDHNQLNEQLMVTVLEAVSFLPIPIRDIITTEQGVVESFAQQLRQMLSGTV